MVLYKASKRKMEQSKTVTATTSPQIIAPDEGYQLTSVTVNPQVHSATKTISTRELVDLGAQHNYRKIDTRSFPRGFSETLLWENSAPATSFEAQDMTLNYNISSYDFIKIVYRQGTSSSATNEVYAPASLFPEYIQSAGHRCVTLGLRNSSNDSYNRQIWYVSDSKLHAANCLKASASGTSNGLCIPTYVYGCNFR